MTDKAYQMVIHDATPSVITINSTLECKKAIDYILSCDINQLPCTASIHDIRKHCHSIKLELGTRHYTFNLYFHTVDHPIISCDDITAGHFIIRPYLDHISNVLKQYPEDSNRINYCLGILQLELFYLNQDKTINGWWGNAISAYTNLCLVVPWETTRQLMVNCVLARRV